MNDTLSKIEKRTAYILTLPAVILVFAIILFPIFANIWISFKEVGLKDIRIPEPRAKKIVKSISEEPSKIEVIYKLRNSSLIQEIRDIKFIDKIPKNTEDIKNIRDKALILIGFYSFCRRSELLGMRYEHLNFEDDGVQVLIPFSKTDQKGEGRMIHLPKTNTPYCPVTALKNWLEMSLIDNGPLFYKINKANNIEKYILNKRNQKISLTDTSFVLILKRRAEEAGLDNCEKISGHSLRIGSITQARMNGVPTHEIMAQSGHKTTQMIDRYTKLSNIRETSAAKKI